MVELEFDSTGKSNLQICACACEYNMVFETNMKYLKLFMCILSDILMWENPKKKKHIHYFLFVIKLMYLN